MVHQYLIHRSEIRAVFIVLLILGASILTSRAQDNGLNLTQTAEYDIGLDCPVTATLDPAGTTYWVLMDNCFQSNYSLHAYNIVDGTQVNSNNYAEILKGLKGVYVDWAITPMGFTPTGDLSIRYNNAETYESINLLIPLATGGEAVTQTSATYNTLLAQYTDYPEFSTYSPDHTRVVAVGATSFHILDVQSETEIVEISAEGSTDNTIAGFSADGKHVHIIRFNNTENTNDHSSTLLIYNLPDGKLLKQYPVPSSAVWVSPDEAYAAVQNFSNNAGDLSELVVINLNSGVTSPASNLLENPAPVTTCLNTGNNVSDLSYVTSGRLSMPSLHWLTDGSGLVLPLSYNGEGAEGTGSSCIFDHSRLRTYTVKDAGS